jgi:PAS domain S-box-containing protein
MFEASLLSIHSPVNLLLEDTLPAASREVLLGAANALELIDEAATITLPNRRFVYVNPAFERLYGFSAASMLGRVDLPIHTRSVPDQLIETIFEGTATGGWCGEIENQSRSGTRFDIHLRTRPLACAGGEVVGYLGICHPTFWQRISPADQPSEHGVTKPSNDLQPLSKRETDVLSCYGLGLNTKEVANQLKISTPSVFTYRSRIMQKLGLKSPADFYMAARQCLVENGPEKSL